MAGGNAVSAALLLPTANPTGFTSADEGVVGLDTYAGLPATYKNGRGYVVQGHWAWEMNSKPPGGDNWSSNSAWANTTNFGTNPVTLSRHATTDTDAVEWWRPTFDPALTGGTAYQSSTGDVLMPCTGGTMVIFGTFTVALEVWTASSIPATDISITAFLEGCRTADATPAAEIWRDTIIWPGGTQSIDTFPDLPAQFTVLARQNGVPGAVSNARAPRLYVKTSLTGTTQGGIKALTYQLRGYLFPQQAARTPTIISNPVLGP